MTRKDYKLIAGVIKDIGLIPKFNQNLDTRLIQMDIILNVAVELANRLGRENPRFNSDIFLKECGVK